MCKSYPFLYIDYEKAFDSIEWQNLLGIIKSQNIPDTLLETIVDKLTKNIIIQFNSKLSKRAENIIGVLQAWYILIYEIITKWQKEDSKGIPLTKKSSTVKIVICHRPRNNICLRRQIAESCV